MATAVGLPEPATPSGSLGSFALVLATPDVDVMYSHLRGKGVEFLTPPADRADGRIRTAHHLDPDGNVLEFYRGMRERSGPATDRG